MTRYYVYIDPKELLKTVRQAEADEKWRAERDISEIELPTYKIRDSRWWRDFKVGKSVVTVRNGWGRVINTIICEKTPNDVKAISEGESYIRGWLLRWGYKKAYHQYWGVIWPASAAEIEKQATEGGAE